jgi:hypothetical protein
MQASIKAMHTLTAVIDNDVACVARGLGADHALNGNNLANEGVLLLGNVDLHVGLIPIRGGLKETEVLARSRQGRSRRASGGNTVIRNLRQRGSHPQAHLRNAGSGGASER